MTFEILRRTYLGSYSLDIDQSCPFLKRPFLILFVQLDLGVPIPGDRNAMKYSRLVNPLRTLTGYLEVVRIVRF